MKVIKARINWNDGYANAPELQILVDRIPELSEFVFNKKGPLYFAELDGAVKFFYYDRPGDGYGGCNFTVKLDTGEEVILKGPWSSNSVAMNSAGFTDSIPVSMTDKPEAFEKGYTFYASHITVDLAKEACKKIQGACMLKISEEKYASYCITKIGVYGRNENASIELA